MQISKSVPAHWIDRSQAIMTTFLVLGPGHSHATAGNHAGRIKAVRFGPSVMSPLVEVEWIVRDGRRAGCKGLHITSEEAAKGTRFLRDLYTDEGRLDDFDRYVARETAITHGLVVDPLDELDPRLPAKVLEWRRGRGVTDKFQWDIEPTPTPAPEIADEKPVPRRRQVVEPPAGGAF